MKRKPWSGRVGYLGTVFVVVLALLAWTAATVEKKVTVPIQTKVAVGDESFAQSMNYLLGPGLTEGNRIEGLVNGREIFPAVFDAIRQAERSITLETYIWESGEVGGELKRLLSEKARAGVKVCALADGMGTLKLKHEDMDEMRKAGVRFVKYQRKKWYNVHPNLNHRTHRKIVVVDGKIGFTGGVCIGDKWLGDAEDLQHWRDNHYRIEGPAVGQLQAIFADNWLETTGEVLEGADFFPVPRLAGNSRVQCFRSGPSDGRENARLAHLYAIAAARKSIRLGHAYFVPDDLSIQTLLDARRRGVDVEIIVPGKHDSSIGRAASRSRWGELADAGVKFYQFQPALYHCKVMIVDDRWVTAGSVNFDNRSFHINDEANFNVLDADFAAGEIRQFEADKAKSRLMTAAELKARPWYQKAADRCAGLLRSQL